MNSDSKNDSNRESSFEIPPLPSLDALPKFSENSSSSISTSNNPSLHSMNYSAKGTSLVMNSKGEVVETAYDIAEVVKKFDPLESEQEDPISNRPIAKPSSSTSSPYASTLDLPEAARILEMVKRESPKNSSPSLEQAFIQDIVSGDDNDINKFNYNEFLDQLRNPKAVSIIKYLESFVRKFDQLSSSVSQQVKMVNEFSQFILSKMLQTEVWHDVDDSQLDFLKEGVEQYLMNRLHSKTFCPKSSDDSEKDHVLKQKISIFRWITEEHLDIPSSDQNKYYFFFAQQELLKMNNFKTPRHKMVCILNACKFIFGLLKKVEETNAVGADKFLPILIYVVIQSNPPFLNSNVQYISRYRHSEALSSESGYYLTNLIGAISFIENIDPSSLSITKEEFEANVELTLKELNSDSVNFQHQVPHLNSPSTDDNFSSAPDSPARSILERGSQIAQNSIKKPLDIVSRFLNNSDSDISPPGSEKNAPLPSPLRPRPSKSFFNYLFGDSEDDDDDGQAYQSSRIPPPTHSQFELAVTNLSEMFPGMDREILDSILKTKNGDMTATIETLLEMTEVPDHSHFGTDNHEDLGVKDLMIS